MSRNPGHVTVTNEVGYCTACGRPRNLRREERQVGEMVRAIVTCETCHRTLSNTMVMASSLAATAEPAAAVETEDAAAPVAALTAAEPAAARPKSPVEPKPPAKPKLAAKPKPAKPKPAKPKPKASKSRATKRK